MSGLLDKAEVQIPCFSCGCKTTKTFDWIKSHKTFNCKCGTQVNFEADQFKREIQNVDRALDDFRNAMKNFGK